MIDKFVKFLEFFGIGALFCGGTFFIVFWPALLFHSMDLQTRYISIVLLIALITALGFAVKSLWKHFKEWED
jgi:hypothetical protein